MTTPTVLPKFTRRQLLLILGGVVLVLSLCVLAFLLFGPVIMPGGTIENQKARVFPHIEKAIHATFPGYCNGADDQLTIEPGFIITGVVERWTVRCVPDKTPWNEPFVDINIDACTISRPLSSSMEWSQIYRSAVDKDGNLPHLVGCS